MLIGRQGVRVWVRDFVSFNEVEPSADGLADRLADEREYDDKKFTDTFPLQYFGMLGGRPVHPDSFLSGLKTTEPNPLELFRCKLYTRENGGKPQMLPYKHHDTLSTIAGADQLVLRDGIVVPKDTLIISFHDSRINPLRIEDFTNHLTIISAAYRPGTVDFVKCKTLQDLVARLENQLKIETSVTCSQKYTKNMELDAIFRGDFSFRIVDKDKPHARFSLTQSASLSAKPHNQNKILSQTIEYPLCAHYIAMEVYDCGNVSQECYEFARKVQMILQKSDDPQFESDDKMYTSMLATALDRFVKIFSHCWCLHQCSLIGNEVPDFCITDESQNGIPQQIKLVGDFKLKSVDEALVQSFHYCMSLSDNIPKVRPLFAMPASCETFKLILCIPQPQKLAYIKIKEANVANLHELASLFHSLMSGLKNVELPEFTPEKFVVTPKDTLRLEDATMFNHRVFKKGDRVYKIYDGTNSGSPNKSIIELAGENGLMNMEETNLTSNGRFKMLSYSFIDGGKNDLPSDLRRYAPIGKVLDILHRNKIVHSDVRPENMVFSQRNAVLIDFDLADGVGKPYPLGYNINFGYRHAEAKAGKAREIDHDRYSFLQILREHVNITVSIIDGDLETFCSRSN